MIIFHNIEPMQEPKMMADFNTSSAKVPSWFNNLYDCEHSAEFRLAWAEKPLRRVG